MRNNSHYYPSVSFVIPTYNSEKTLIKCLRSINNQRYPKDKIEIILADGGSKDTTKQISQNFKCRFIPVRSTKQGAEYNRAIGATKATNTIIAFLDHDNVLPHTKWLSSMTLPFTDKTITGVETLRYAYDSNAGYLGRYFSLLCANDVLPFYLGKADRISYMYKHITDYGVFKNIPIKKNKNFYIVDFTPDAIPTLGSNGFLVRKNILLKHADVRPDYFFHIDVNVDLIRKGYNRYAFVDDSIIHETNERGIIDYLRRRKIFVETYQFTKASKRRFRVYEKKDRNRLIWIVFIGLTLVIPLIDAIKGYKQIKDKAWFLHPVISFTLIIVYGFTIAKLSLTSYGKKTFS